MKKGSKYLSYLSPPDDKYDAPEYNLAIEHLPDYVTEPIPGCVYDRTTEGEGEDAIVTLRYRLDIIQVLFWVMCKRDKPDITLEEVGRGIKANNVRDLVMEVFYFWSESTREELEEILPDRNSDTGQADEDTQADAENPPGKMVVTPLKG